MKRKCKRIVKILGLCDVNKRGWFCSLLDQEIVCIRSPRLSRARGHIWSNMICVVCVCVYLTRVSAIPKGQSTDTTQRPTSSHPPPLPSPLSSMPHYFVLLIFIVVVIAVFSKRKNPWKHIVELLGRFVSLVSLLSCVNDWQVQRKKMERKTIGTRALCNDFIRNFSPPNATTSN